MRAPAGSKLGPFKDEIERLLQAEPSLPGTRVRELLGELGYAGGKTILDDYLRELRPRYLPRPRTFQRTIYRPGEILQVDLFALRRSVPVGYGRVRKGFVVLSTLGFSRATSGALVFSKEPPDQLWAICRGIWRLGGLPELVVSDREAALHAGGGRPTEAYARLLGELCVGHLILEPRDAQAKGLVENRGRYLRANFEPGRAFANEFDCQDQLDSWCEQANARVHRYLGHRRIRHEDRIYVSGRSTRTYVPPHPHTASPRNLSWPGIVGWTRELGSIRVPSAPRGREEKGPGGVQAGAHHPPRPGAQRPKRGARFVSDFLIDFPIGPLYGRDLAL